MQGYFGMLSRMASSQIFLEFLFCLMDREGNETMQHDERMKPCKGSKLVGLARWEESLLCCGLNSWAGFGR